jgi:hypothetical protein
MIWRTGQSSVYGLRGVLTIRILTPYLASQHNDNYPKVNYQSYNLRDEVEVDGQVFRNQHISHKEDHYKLARKVAAESTM